VASLAILLHLAFRGGFFNHPYLVASPAEVTAIIVLNVLLPLLAIPLGVWGLVRPTERNLYAALGLLLSSAQLLTFGAALLHAYTTPF
jgi:hypothetical protein